MPPNTIGAGDDSTTEDTTEAADDDATEGDDEPEGEGDPTYEELLADRDHWKTMAEAAGAGKAAAEAAKYRTKLREAERERDDLQGLVNNTRQSIVDSAVAAAQLDQRHWNAADVPVTSLLGADGLIDDAKLSAALVSAGELTQLKPRRPAPNPLAGRVGSAEQRPSGKAVWDSAFGVGQR
jgi:hypothetical protein